ncbi:hypothetical protein [Streptomyces mirabilis]
MTARQTDLQLASCLRIAEQRGTNDRGDLDAVALNGRPRKTLAWKTPGEAFSERLRFLTGSVATTP